MRLEKRVRRIPPLCAYDEFCGQQDCDCCFVTVIYAASSTDEEYAEWLSGELEKDASITSDRPAKLSEHLTVIEDNGFLASLLNVEHVQHKVIRYQYEA